MGQYLISTDVSVQTCRKCKVWVLAAWSEGVFVEADVAAVSRVGELVALRTGRRTFVLCRSELVERTRSRIELEGPRLLIHRCGDPPLILAEPSGDEGQCKYTVDPDGPIPF